MCSYRKISGSIVWRVRISVRNGSQIILRLGLSRLLKLVARLVASLFFFFQAEDGIRDDLVTGVQTCALPICTEHRSPIHHQLHAARLRDQRQSLAAAGMVAARAGGSKDSRTVSGSHASSRRDRKSVV